MAKGENRSTGRPSSFSAKLGEVICARLADGRSLRSICADGDMPSATTVFRWLADEKYSAFREQYTRAREAQADAIFDEILDIADDVANDTRKGPNGEDLCDHEWISRSRLRVDARKWMAGKLAPKKYGDKLDVGLAVSGEIVKTIVYRNAG